MDHSFYLMSLESMGLWQHLPVKEQQKKSTQTCFVRKGSVMFVLARVPLGIEPVFLIMLGNYVLPWKHYNIETIASVSSNTEYMVEQAKEWLTKELS